MQIQYVPLVVTQQIPILLHHNHNHNKTNQYLLSIYYEQPKHFTCIHLFYPYSLCWFIPTALIRKPMHEKCLGQADKLGGARIRDLTQEV